VRAEERVWVSLSIVFAMLVSALLHATWNSLAHAVSDRLVGFALIGVVDAVAGDGWRRSRACPQRVSGRS
jgi:hypothetical protein